MNNPQKVAIIGGTGKAGRHIAAEALQKGYQVRMLVRDPGKLKHLDKSIEIVKGSIQDIEAIRLLLKGCGTVINTFGQPYKDKPIYSESTENILDAMKEFEIRRYIGVTGGSLTIEGDKKSIWNRIGAKMFDIFLSTMMKDKKREWEILNETEHIEWTLIRLPFIIDGIKTAHVKENLVDMPGTKITNQDIASFIISQINDFKYIKKAPFISH
ncbi:NAD(P)H-binding protein [Lysinibacillus odysseyi]|uniref:NADH-flavin reductase n=1 Tax=Lysinibacillus odysseyi 34hs-1 = NBRC 100172 TaxID=1220589 RepID=A0A0A3JEE6_9BACI|nr:NAD(P)H-binding protein [Lysinibacillus odysseyi]KGR85402.1 NADH-flavin reductase [Lysinibacillus odysseyi 34hs-1 = NBRC 100172]